MQNKLTILLVSLLTTSVVFAQDDFESVDDIMSELMNYSEEEAPASEATAPMSEESASDAVDQSESAPSESAPVVTEAPEAVVQPVAESVVTEEKAMEPTPNEPVVKTVDPQDVKMDDLLGMINKAHEDQQLSLEQLRMLTQLVENYPDMDPSYLQTLISERRALDRGHKTAEVGGMQAVDDAWSTELVLRTYHLIPGAGKRMQLGDKTRAIEVEKLFSVVRFPSGSSAIYQPETETLFVVNSEKNLAIMDAVLETMGVLRGFGDAQQVEIEAKFVEVSEGTLEELGFQWNYLNDPVTGGNLEIDDGDGGLFAESLRGSPNNSDNGLLPFDQKIDLGDGAAAASGAWSTFRFVDTFNTEPSQMTVVNEGSDPFEVVISALDQSTGADVLSAPRILTRSGEEASIQVGELHYFPEVYEGDAAQATIVNVSYEDFEERLLGVELVVTPKVTDERDIMIELNPRITELVGWQSYQLLPGSVPGTLPGQTGGKQFIGSHYNHRQLESAQPYQAHDPILARLPIMKKREIQTQVTMADGSTIGMGGLINERIDSFDDRVPFLGSIPLVGRLFRNEGERVVKRNLLMFVTARVVEPNGRVNASRSFE